MTRAAVFAARVLRRHGRHIGRPRSLARILLRRPSPAVHQGRSSVMVSPRIVVALHNGTTVRTEMRTVARTAPHVETVVRYAPRRSAATTVGSGVHERVVQRLIERTERVEADVFRIDGPARAASRHAVQRVPAQPSAPPLELVIARPLAATASPAPPPPEPPALEGWGPPHPFGQRAPEPPKVDVEALTDQVMHSIDRRIVAYRERTGRV
jgi:hypothetical protein